MAAAPAAAAREKERADGIITGVCDHESRREKDATPPPPAFDHDIPRRSPGSPGARPSCCCFENDGRVGIGGLPPPTRGPLRGGGGGNAPALLPPPAFFSRTAACSRSAAATRSRPSARSRRPTEEARVWAGMPSVARSSSWRSEVSAARESGWNKPIAYSQMRTARSRLLRAPAVSPSEMWISPMLCWPMPTKWCSAPSATSYSSLARPIAARASRGRSISCSRIASELRAEASSHCSSARSSPATLFAIVTNDLSYHRTAAPYDARASAMASRCHWSVASPTHPWPISRGAAPSSCSCSRSCFESIVSASASLPCAHSTSTSERRAATASAWPAPTTEAYALRQRRSALSAASSSSRDCDGGGGRVSGRGV